MPLQIFGRRLLYVLACILPVWAVVAYFTGGVGWSIGPVRLSSRQPFRPFLIGVLLFGWYVWRYPRNQREEDGRWMLRALEPAIPVAVAVACLVGLYVGLRYGSFAAAGSDSYGYVSQARLWLDGTLRLAQPWVEQFSWPDREWMFAPLGYRPYGTDGTIVPTYPPGLSMLMALFSAVFGENGPFFVAPACGAAMVWLTYALGREATGSRHTGVIAAVFLAASPAFLNHVMAPMSDVPAAAGWALVALLLLKGGGRRYMSLAGWVAGLTLLVRPNLFLLALLPAVLWRPWEKTQDALIRYAIGLAPSLFAIMALNVYLYGGPLTSGYGALLESYGFAALPANVRNYLAWLVMTQTPLVFLASIPLFARGALRGGTDAVSPRICLSTLLALTFLSYAFYSPFDHWFYLRFLLPGYPALFVLLAAAIVWIAAKAPIEARLSVAALICTLIVGSGVKVARDTGIFNSAEYERRHIRAAAALASLAPANAMVLAVQHSGSVRYYANRITLRYDWLKEDQLDTAVRDMLAAGFQPFILIDDWEADEFRRRFSASSRLGKLDWEPVARVAGQPEVRIYELK